MRVISLRELQRAFLAGVANDSPGDIRPWIVEGGLSAERGLQIYRNNSRIVFEAALKSIYPVICRLGGAEWFTQTARAYQRLHPSPSGDLNDVGANFAQFLAGEWRGSEYEYFIDVAQLEWAYQQACSEPEAEVAGLDALSALSASELNGLKFLPNPTAHAIASSYPLFEIWKTNRHDVPSGETRIDLRTGPSRVLLVRRRDHVEVRELPREPFELFQAFAAGCTVVEAADRLTGSLGEFDLAAAMLRLIRLHAVVGFRIDEQ